MAHWYHSQRAIELKGKEKAIEILKAWNDEIVEFIKKEKLDVKELVSEYAFDKLSTTPTLPTSELIAEAVTRKVYDNTNKLIEKVIEILKREE